MANERALLAHEIEQHRRDEDVAAPILRRGDARTVVKRRTFEQRELLREGHGVRHDGERRVGGDERRLVHLVRVDLDVGDAPAERRVERAPHFDGPELHAS